MLYDVHIVINSLKLYTMGPLPYSHCHFLQFYCSVTNALITLISFIQPNWSWHELYIIENKYTESALKYKIFDFQLFIMIDLAFVMLWSVGRQSANFKIHSAVDLSIFTFNLIDFLDRFRGLIGIITLMLLLLLLLFFFFTLYFINSM